MTNITIREDFCEVRSLKIIAARLERSPALPAALLFARGNGAASGTSMELNGKFVTLWTSDAVAIYERAAMLAGALLARNRCWLAGFHLTGFSVSG